MLEHPADQQRIRGKAHQAGSLPSFRLDHDHSRNDHPKLHDFLLHLPGRKEAHVPVTADPAALSLPPAVELYKLVTGSHHYHVGYFQDRSDALRDALDRIVVRCIPYMVPKGITLDLGCGIGGATSLLSDHAFPVLGVDPNRSQVRFAGRTLGPRRNMAFAVLGLDDLLKVRTTIDSFFDNIMANEILQFFPDLVRFCRGCRGLLRSGGALVINDIATVPALTWDSVPYHRKGSLCRAAEAAGLRVEEQHDVSSRVKPTLDRLIERAARRSDDDLERFYHRHARAQEIIDEQIYQWEQVRQGFKNGDLIYETTILRKPRKNTHHE